jgi:hypothetical protein
VVSLNGNAPENSMAAKRRWGFVLHQGNVSLANGFFLGEKRDAIE